MNEYLINAVWRVKSFTTWAGVRQGVIKGIFGVETREGEGSGVGSGKLSLAL